MPRSPVAPRVTSSVAEMREWRAERRRPGESVALVPTMGALHEGHLSLVRRGRESTDRVALSIYVNPTQFGPGEDFEDYPRDLDRDLRLAADHGVDAVFVPATGELYPVEPTIWVEPGPLADRLCGRYRPGHFRGVLTVVAKLLAIVQPESAVFGRKDFQQLVLLRRMVRELHLPVRIEEAPIVREEDGLAMSSRNRYLSGSDRRVARSLAQALKRVRARFSEGVVDVGRLEADAAEHMRSAGAEVQYVEIVEPTGLHRPAVASGDSVCAIAAYVGGTRLIDNAPLGGTSSVDDYRG